MDSVRTSPQHPRVAGARVTVRLLALVMLPLTVLFGLGGSVVLSHRTAARQAIALDRGVVQLGHLVALRDAIGAEQSAQAFTVRFTQLGVSAEEAAEFLGVDWSAQSAPARARAVAAVRALGTASPITVEGLGSLYDRIDGEALVSGAAGSELAELSEKLWGTASRVLDRLELGAGDADLVATLESLRVAGALVQVATPLVIDLSAVWFPSPADTPSDSADARARLEMESAAYLDGIAQLRELGVGPVLTSLRRVDVDPEVQAFDAAVASTLAGMSFSEAGAPIDDAVVASALRGRLVLGSLLDDVVATATAAVHAEAGPLAAAERATFERWIAGSVIVALASLAIALWMARSISRPLQELARYANAVNEGHLDTELVTRLDRGPRETRMALGVFTDLVTNLQLLDAKANALAQCDFDDPVLLAPLPGRLGRSLDDSVALLSGSIVERDELQTHLAHQATHDSLTGIGNRTAAVIGIRAATARSARTGSATALLFVDLNEFKAVNGSHGHEVGDEVLRQVATRLTSCLRSTDLSARLGGDEFVVVAESIDNAADAAELAKRIIDAVSEPIDVGSASIAIGAAVGIAMTLDGPEEPLRLLARADAAMHRAKHHDRSAVEIFDADLQAELVEREDVEAALTAALRDPDGGGLHLLFQPVVDAQSGTVTGAEALVRWDRPGHGRLDPDAFIPIAETTALIIELDRWVLATAVRELVGWSSIAALADVPMSVNVSGRHLLSRLLPGHLRAVLEETGVDPRKLSIEITETVLLTDLTAAAAELDAVRALGVSVAIDDFGTGYTSLAHLQKLPIDTIKIDRSFISHLDEQRSCSLVRMVTDLGHANDLRIVAEGVETPAELSVLQAIGADDVQGFLFSRPLEPAAIAMWASERRVLCPV